MNKIFDKIGYILIIIIGFIVFVIKFKVLFVYSSDYLLFGDKSEVLIKRKEFEDGYYIYTCRVDRDEGRLQFYTSFPTKKDLAVADKTYGLLAPHFNIVLISNFSVVPYIFSILVFILLSLASVVAVLKIFNYSTVTIFGKRFNLESQQ